MLRATRFQAITPAARGQVGERLGCGKEARLGSVGCGTGFDDMYYDGARTAEGFRRQSLLAEALYRTNLKSYGKTIQAFLAHHQIVALWSIYDYLAQLPVCATRAQMLRLLAQVRSGPWPERLKAGVPREDWYAAHRDQLLANLIERFENESELAPLAPRPGKKEAG